MENLVKKLEMLMDQLPENVRAIVINKYSWDWKPQSKNVSKILDMIEKLSGDEIQELKVFISQSMKNGWEQSEWMSQ